MCDFYNPYNIRLLSQGLAPGRSLTPKTYYLMEVLSNMDIEQHDHFAKEIVSNPCRTETKDTYEDELHQYENNNYTYIPMPEEGSYYNVDKGWMRDIHDEQYISGRCHLMNILYKMKDFSFLLIETPHHEVVSIGGIPRFQFLLEEDELYFRVASDPHLLDEEEMTSIKIPEENLTRNLLDHLNWEDKSSLQGYTLELLVVRVELPDLYDKFLNNYESLEYDFGIITLSDINKRPMKEMIYKVISELTYLLSDKIEQEYDERSDILYKAASPETVGRWEKSRREGINLHMAEYMTMIDMMKVLKQSDKSFVKECGFSSKSEVDNLSGINNLRNKVMHANRTLVLERQDIDDVLEKVNQAQDIINEAKAS